ncbi:reverse transcriptase domain-containing protein [Tanacetum coccineum]
MRTRNSNFLNNSTVTILRRRNRGRAPNIVEPKLRTIVEVAPMAEHTMEELMMFPYSLEGNARLWYEKEPPNSILTWEDLVTKFVNQFFPPSKTTHLKNEISRFIQKFEETFSAADKDLRMNMTSRESVSKKDERIDKLADQISTLVEIVSKKVVTPASVKEVEEICVTCVEASCLTNLQNMLSGFFQNQASTSGTLLSNTIPTLKGEMKAITTRSDVAYEGPSIPTNPSPKKAVECETEETTDKEQTNFQGSTAHIPPPVIPIPISEPDVPKTLPNPNIPYPSRRNNQKSRDKASNQMEKIFQIFQDLRSSTSGTLLSNTIPTLKGEMKAITTRIDVAYEGPSIPTNPSPKKAVE